MANGAGLSEHDATDRFCLQRGVVPEGRRCFLQFDADDQARCRKRPCFEPFLHKRKRSIYQDSLRTDIGKVEKEGAASALRDGVCRR